MKKSIALHLIIVLTSNLVCMNGDIQQSMEELPLISGSSVSASWKIVDQIKKLRSLSPGSLNSYLYPLGIAGINFATLYTGYILKELINKLGNHDLDGPFYYTAGISLTAGATLIAAPLCRGAYYAGRQWYQRSQISTQITQQLTPSQIRQIVHTLESISPIIKLFCAVTHRLNYLTYNTYIT